MRTRLVILNTPEPRAGSAQYVSKLAKSLAASGETIVLFCPSNFAYKQELAAAGITMSFPGMRSTRSSGLTARACRNLWFLCRTFVAQLQVTGPQDIMHFQFPLYFPAGLILFLIARLQAHRIVYTAHDPVPHKWLLPRALRWIEQGCLRWAYRLSDRIIVHNLRGKELLTRTFSVDPDKIAVIPHGCTVLKPADVSFSDSETLKILLFGSIREDKGLDLAIEAIQRINSHGPRVQLLIAGTTANAREQDYWNRCKRAIDRQPCGITVIDRYISDEEVPSLIANCHAVLLPYRNFESESGVVAAALSSGRPVVATTTGSISALLDVTDAGIPIRSTTVAGVEEAIHAALRIGPGGLRKKGLDGLDFVRSTRSWEMVGKETAKLYAEITKHHTDADSQYAER